MSVPSASEITDKHRWCLGEAVKVSNNATDNTSLAFSFPWITAGRYKAAIGSAGTFTNGVVIAEQHTE